MTNAGQKARVCLVGAGSISWTHAEALRSLGIPIVAVVDPNAYARARLAASFQIAQTFASIDEAIASGGFERAHVLVPPDLHAEAALKLLRAGKSVLVEKPMATTISACQALIDAATHDARVGVNQNFVYHPAFVRLREALANHTLGPARFVEVLYHAELRQLGSRQFGHWMFREPRNILLEQAVHPLSQLITLCGDIDNIAAIGGKAIEIAPGAKLTPSFTSALKGQRADASLRFAVGQDFPFWQVRVSCDDGILCADILTNRFWAVKRTRWMQPVDDFLMGHATALAIVVASWRNFVAYCLSMVKLGDRSDSFFLSMRGCIAAFHHALDEGEQPLLDGAFGRDIVAMCDRIAEQIMPQEAVAPTRVLPSAGVCDVAILGGTGFIGTALVSHLLDAGRTVSVMARNLTNLPDIFRKEGVTLQRGDIRNADDVARAIAGAKIVVNLAHGGGGANWEEIRDAMVGGAEVVAQQCLTSGAKRLIYVGSIAALYLGPQSGPITGVTPTDPQADQRADYARAKAVSEERLHQLLAKSPLELCILRPGLVVGKGTSPFHSGLGFFNNDQHCIGWNEGDNRLPFVLVDDVADAIVQSCTSPAAAGKSYNLVGDVRPSAREYIAELGKTLQRPLRFHAKRPFGLYLNELGKWLVKRLGGRNVPMPSQRDILSRGLRAAFDCGDAKSDLDWKPEANAERFYTRAFETAGS